MPREEVCAVGESIFWAPGISRRDPRQPAFLAFGPVHGLGQRPAGPQLETVAARHRGMADLMLLFCSAQPHRP